MDHEEPPFEKFASPKDAGNAIESLGPADFVKLMLIARRWSKRFFGTHEQAQDLLYDTILKTLDGTRRWNTSVSITKHLDRAMESDAGHIAKEKRKHPMVELSGNDTKVSGPTLDERIDTADRVEKVMAVFLTDPEARALLQLKLSGHSPVEIRQELGLDLLRYETVNKRIRRHLAKSIAGGNQL